MKSSFLILIIFLVISDNLFSQTTIQGTISGVVKDSSTRQPLEFINVLLLNPKDSSIITGNVTDNKGTFLITKVSYGDYLLKFSSISYQTKNFSKVRLNSQQSSIDLGIVYLKEINIKLDEVTITSQKDLFTNAIDRKVYNIEKDIMSSTGSVSDLLQNIPSVQVDVDGSISLRGSGNVQILIDGKPSPFSLNGSADMLQQIPAGSVERIEVITNPSAKFKPDGTSGIINIVLKKDANTGFNGNMSASLGTAYRYNLNASGNYNSNGFNIFGSYNLRQEERNAYSSDIRKTTDSITSSLGDYNQQSYIYNRPVNHFITFGIDYKLNDFQNTGFSLNYRKRAYTSDDKSITKIWNNGLISSDYDRKRLDYDKTDVIGATAFFQHKFVGDDNKIRIEGNFSKMSDEEDNRFTNIFRTPVNSLTFDNTLIKETNTEGDITADYHYKINELSTFEAGYDGKFAKADFPFSGEFFDAAKQTFVNDTNITSHFEYRQAIHAVYGTIETRFGLLSLLAGLRIENATITSNLISKNFEIPNNYFKIYPTLHATYKINDLMEFQLNYSLRANRPESDDLNPFPEYQNPRNIRSGNPKLKPEFIHSIEFGILLQNDSFTFVPSLFYRNRYNAFTWVITALNDSTLFTTHDNLSNDQSGGIEMVLSGNLGGWGTMNVSLNGFYQEIDATNLGFSNKKSNLSWSGSVNCSFNLYKSLVFQVNSNFRSSRLAPQGEFKPNYIVNLALRQELLDGRISLFCTISDIFASLKREYEVSTALFNQQSLSSRDSRVISCGLTYRFGTLPKKSKEKTPEFDSGD